MSLMLLVTSLNTCTSILQQKPSQWKVKFGSVLHSVSETRRFSHHDNDRGCKTPINVDTSESYSVTESMRVEALHQYSKVMDHYMFELGNEIMFLESHDEVSSYVEANFDSILFDCDGVIYRGSDPIPDAASSIKSILIDQKKKVLFVTNNAGSSREEMRRKLSEILDYDDFKTEQMVCSGYVAARYLQKTLKEKEKRNVHVIGMEGLCEELRNAGFQVSGGPSDNQGAMTRDELAVYPFTEGNGQIDAVVVGLDTEFNYRKLCIATVLLQKYPNALFVATNEDAYDLVGADSRHLPGNGALVKAIEYASQRNAINVGKPSTVLTELLNEEYGLDPARTLMIGDRLDTDIRFGKISMTAALVLTGCTTAKTLIALGEGTDEEPLPHIIFPHIGMMGLNRRFD